MKRIGLFYRIVFGLFFVGFLFGLSDRPVFFNYSSGYLAFLIVLSAGFFLPDLIRYVVGKTGRRDAVLASLAGVISCSILYLGASAIFYYTRSYPFDPFLQIHSPPLVNDGSKLDPPWRILALGGSTTRNGNLNVADRYPEHLESTLNDGGASRVSVVNGGMDWYTSKHSLINYATNARDLKPNVVLVMHGVNDLYRSCTPKKYASPSYQNDWSHFYGPSARGAYPPTFERFLYQKFLEAVAWHWYRPLRINEIDYSIDYYQSLPDFEKSMGRLVEMLRRDSEGVVLITQPSLFKSELSSEERRKLMFGSEFCSDRRDWFRWTYPSPSSLGRAMAAYNDATRRVALAQNVPLIEAENEIPKDLEHFSDDVHYTATGSRKLGAFVAKELGRLRLDGGGNVKGGHETVPAQISISEERRQ